MLQAKCSLWLAAAWAATSVAMAQGIYVSDIHDKDDGPKEGAKEVFIVGARNGGCSGKVIAPAGSKATIGDLKGPGGVIPASRIAVRYGVSWGETGFGLPGGNDMLYPASPEQGPDGKGGKQPIWITVEVPKDAKPGIYAGELSVEGAGKVPVKLEVADWILPDTQDYRTLVDLVQSPETLAAEYDLPLWSDRHLGMVARSLELVGRAGSRSLYVPLIARTNYGNAETMVRWIRKGAGYELDFAPLEKYLDLAVKHMGKPKLVILYAWEIYLKPPKQAAPVEVKGAENTYEWRESSSVNERLKLADKGPAVTVVDGGKAEAFYLPKYQDPAAKALWAPVWAGVRQRLEQRGLWSVAMLGMRSDHAPAKEEVQALHELSGGLPWTSTSHHASWFKENKTGDLYGIAKIGYSGAALGFCYTVNPAKQRTYGWQCPVWHGLYWRFGTWNSSAPSWIRQEAEASITGSQRGISHLGADFWRPFKDKRGRRTSSVTDRFPESYWHSLNIGSWLLAPGPDGPVATFRYELFREGIQECEARIVIEDALTNPAKKAKLGDLAAKAQQYLDDRQRAIYRARGGDEAGVMATGHLSNYRDITAMMYARDAKWSAKAGHEWFLKSDWQASTRQLFTYAGEVERMLGK